MLKNNTSIAYSLPNQYHNTQTRQQKTYKDYKEEVHYFGRNKVPSINEHNKSQIRNTQNPQYRNESERKKEKNIAYMPGNASTHLDPKTILDFADKRRYQQIQDIRKKYRVGDNHRQKHQTYQNRYQKSASSYVPRSSGTTTEYLQQNEKREFPSHYNLNSKQIKRQQQRKHNNIIYQTPIRVNETNLSSEQSISSFDHKIKHRSHIKNQQSKRYGYSDKSKRQILESVSTNVTNHHDGSFTNKFQLESRATYFKKLDSKESIEHSNQLLKENLQSRLLKYEGKYGKIRPGSKNATGQMDKFGIQRVKNKQHSRFDDQINKITDKIRDYERKKKDLNIPELTKNESLQQKIHSEKIKDSNPKNRSVSVSQCKRKLYSDVVIQKPLHHQRKQLYKRNLSTENQEQNLNIQRQLDKYTVESKKQQTHQRKSILKNNSKYTQKSEVEQYNIFKELDKRCAFIQNTKPMYSEKTIDNHQYQHSQRQSSRTPSFGFTLFKIQSEPQDSSASSMSKKSSLRDFQFQQHLNHSKSNNEQSRAFSKHAGKNNSSVKKLVQLLIEQCKLDDELRNCKIWFNGLKNNPSQVDKRWKQLFRVILDSYQRQYPFSQNSRFLENYNNLKEQFSLNSDENNPFFSVNNTSKFNYDLLIKAYINARSHWDLKIYKKFRKSQLVGVGVEGQQKLGEKMLDLQKKGYIQVEDLVRFINFQSGNFFRNRDLTNIFRRLANNIMEQQEQKQQITFDELIQSFTY